MDHLLLNRRSFLKESGMTLAGLYLAFHLGGCEDLIKQIENRPLRRHIDPSSPDTLAVLESYKKAILAMKALDASDPGNQTGWTRQATIHGNANTFLHCKHQSAHFLSWHRAYLFYFEQICRNLSGDPTFALPYWNWSMDSNVPSPFYTDPASLLYLDRDNHPVDLPAYTNHTAMKPVMNEPNFDLFGSKDTAKGALEGSVHDFVHVFVGSNDRTMVRGNSPLDPIFWPHHCMIDYCWYDWNINRRFSNPGDAGWLNTSWPDFYDIHGNPVTDVKAEYTILYPLLAYRYEDSFIADMITAGPAPGAPPPPPVPLWKRSEREIKEIRTHLEKGATVKLETIKRVSFSRGAEINTQIPLSMTFDLTPESVQQLIDKNNQARILLNIGLARFPDLNNFFVRVFINKPDANAATKMDDPNYAGSFAFFGTNGEPGQNHIDMPHHKPGYIVDLTPVMIRLRKENLIQSREPISVQLVTVPIGDITLQKLQTLSIENIDLTIADATVIPK